MNKIIVFGNSGSGKSTLAKKFADEGLAHLDLDNLAWLPTNPTGSSRAVMQTCSNG